jgi:hypothetical protein
VILLIDNKLKAKLGTCGIDNSMLGLRWVVPRPTTLDREPLATVTLLDDIIG